MARTGLRVSTPAAALSIPILSMMRTAAGTVMTLMITSKRHNDSGIPLLLLLAFAIPLLTSLL